MRHALFIYRPIGVQLDVGGEWRRMGRFVSSFNLLGLLSGRLSECSLCAFVCSCGEDWRPYAYWADCGLDWWRVWQQEPARCRNVHTFTFISALYREIFSFYMLTRLSCCSARFVTFVSTIAIFFAIVFFIVGITTSYKGDGAATVTFAVSILVAFVPEGLPSVVTLL